MAIVGGKFKMLVAENKPGIYNAWFYGSNFSAKDMERVMSPENITMFELTLTENGAKTAISYSLTPEYNMTFEFTCGEPVEFGAPYPSKSVMTRCESSLKEVASYEDGTEFTYVTTTSSQGMTTKISGSSGYIGSVFFERVQPNASGFYIAVSQDLEKMIAEDSGCSAAVAAELCTDLALKVTENNGIFTYTDYLGDGTTNGQTFKMGQETDMVNGVLGLNGKQIMTNPAPGQYVTAYQDANGKNSIWKATLEDGLFTFTVEKPMNTTGGSITYKRYPDFTGSFRNVHTSGAAAFLQACGEDPAAADAYENDRSTSTMKCLGKGMFEWSSDSKVLGIDPIVYKFGQEFSYVWGGKTVTEVINPTEEGLIGSYKMPNGVIGKFKAVVGETFMTIEETVDGAPGVKISSIFIRV